MKFFSWFLLFLHLGMPILLQADHGHFLGVHRNTGEQVQADTCCPSESHKPPDSIDHCSFCQRALTTFGIFAFQSVVPEHRSETFIAQVAQSLALQRFTFGTSKRGPPSV